MKLLHADPGILQSANCAILAHAWPTKLSISSEHMIREVLHSISKSETYTSLIVLLSI